MKWVDQIIKKMELFKQENFHTVITKFHKIILLLAKNLLHEWNY